MREVAIVGIGQTPVGEHWNASLRSLAAEAIHAALVDAGSSHVDALYIGNAYGATVSSQSQLGALIADFAGLGGVEAFTVEAAEASGGAAHCGQVISPSHPARWKQCWYSACRKIIRYGGHSTNPRPKRQP